MLMLIPYDIVESVHFARNMGPDLMVEDTADTLSGSKFMLSYGLLGSLTVHQKRKYGPTLSLCDA